MSKARGESTPTAIAFGHADADGHLAAEQSRTNLEAEGFAVTEIVVAKTTRNFRFWERSFVDLDFSHCELVVVVDIAFSFRDPGLSLAALLKTVDEHPQTRFNVIDHHPLRRPAKRRQNLTLSPVQKTFDCCYGSPSEELMVLAALCHGEDTSVGEFVTEASKQRALGVRRAAADVDGLAGKSLLTLLRNRQWDYLEALAAEPVELHRTVRGRRRSDLNESPLLKLAKDLFAFSPHRDWEREGDTSFRSMIFKST